MSSWSQWKYHKAASVRHFSSPQQPHRLLCSDGYFTSHYYTNNKKQQQQIQLLQVMKWRYQPLRSSLLVLRCQPKFSSLTLNDQTLYINTEAGSDFVFVWSWDTGLQWTHTPTGTGQQTYVQCNERTVPGNLHSQTTKSENCTYSMCGLVWRGNVLPEIALPFTGEFIMKGHEY